MNVHRLWAGLSLDPIEKVRYHSGRFQFLLDIE